MEVNIEKIHDFVDVWAYSIELTDRRLIDIIKDDIVKRCNQYKDFYPQIDVSDDYCDAYIIKPINGKYALEDFILNRPMLGLRVVSIWSVFECNLSDYTGQYKSLSINIDYMNKMINDKSKRHQGLVGKNDEIIRKTIEHEIGHCLKTTFTNGAKAPIGYSHQNQKYINLINNLKKFKNGKYANQVKEVNELDFDNFSNKIKTGIKDSEEKYGYASGFSCLDELLNETEALSLAGNNRIQEKCYLLDNNGKASSGNYVNVFNYISGYRSYTGYGSILKKLLGESNVFFAEYISSKKIVDIFDMNESYQSIADSVWGLNPNDNPRITPIWCLIIQFYKLQGKKAFNEEIMLELDVFFAKCYEKKIEKIISENNGKIDKELFVSITKEIRGFLSKMTRNIDPNKNKELSHVKTFYSILNKLELLIKKNSKNVVDDNKNTQKNILEIINLKLSDIESKRIDGTISEQDFIEFQQLFLAAGEVEQRRIISRLKLNIANSIHHNLNNRAELYKMLKNYIIKGKKENNRVDDNAFNQLNDIYFNGLANTITSFNEYLYSKSYDENKTNMFQEKFKSLLFDLQRKKSSIDEEKYNELFNLISNCLNDCNSILTTVNEEERIWKM